MKPDATLQRLLVVDDDAGVRSSLAEQLTTTGFHVTTARDGNEMHNVLARSSVDLIILNANLAHEDGLALCREIRAQSAVPVIMLTARTDAIDRIIVLEMGADDCLGKPFELRELLARVRSVLRRTVRIAPDAELSHRAASFAGWTLDLQKRHLLNPQGRVIALSGAEFHLLRVFVMHANEVLTRERLVALSSGREYGSQQRVVDVHISRLRHKLGDDFAESPLLKTVRNEGYVLAAEVALEGAAHTHSTVRPLMNAWEP